MYARSNGTQRQLTEGHVRASHQTVKLVERFQAALKNKECQGFSDFLANCEPYITWQACKDSLDYISLNEINHGFARLLLESCISSPNDALLYVSLFILFKFNVPFKLKSDNILLIIARSAVKFDRELLDSYVKNMKGGVYGVPRIPLDNPDFHGKMMATVLDRFDVSYVDIFSPREDNICKAFKNESFYVENLAAGFKCICKTPSLLYPGKYSFTYCDIPEVEDFNMSPPEGYEGETGTTGLQIACLLMSKC